MPRDIDSAVATRLKENHNVIYFVRIDFDDPVYAHSRVGRVYNIEGNDYVGVGSFGNISDVQSSTELESKSLQLSLSGIEGKFFEELVEKTEYQNRNVYIYKGLLDDDENLIGLIKHWRGLTGNAVVNEGGDVGVKLTVDNILKRWNKAANIRYNSTSWKTLYPDDTCFDYLEEVQANRQWRAGDDS